MADTFTGNKNILMPTPGGDNNVWGGLLNTSSWPAIDNAFGGVTSIIVTGVGAGNYVLTVAQYQPPNIEFTGTLGANLQYSVPSGVGGLWSVYNNTSGNFTLIFASNGGTGVYVPQGQRALLICDGANMQYAQTGGAVSANPTAKVSTSAVGGTAATFMTSDSAPAIDQTMAPVWTGIHSFDAHVAFGSTVSINYYCSLVGPGTVFDGSASTMLAATQAPGDNSTKVASTAFVAALGALKANLASPTFTGTPAVSGAAPALGTATTQIATTAFAAQTFSLAVNGYQVFPSGLIIQWGINTVSSAGSSIAFPITFPTGAFMGICNAFGSAATAYVSSINSSHITMVNGNNSGVSWIAIGN